MRRSFIGRRRAGVVIGSVAIAVASQFVAAGPARANISCGSTITVSMVLTHDLLDCQNGVIIDASNIVLDLGGHVLDGVGNGQPGVGVSINQGRTGVTVRNGTVQQFFVGVALKSFGSDLTAGNAVTGIKILNNRTGISSGGFRNDNNKFQNNVVSGSLDLGIFIRGSGNVVSGNQVSGGVGGIDVADGNGNQIQGNQVTGQTVGGIVLRGGVNTVVSGNVAYNNRVGIRATNETTSGTLVSNGTHSNIEDGIRVSTPGFTLKGNAAHGNGAIGINAVPGVTDGGGNTASGNGTANCVNISCG